MPLTGVMNYVFAYIYLSLNCKQQLQFAAPHQPAADYHRVAYEASGHWFDTIDGQR